MCVCVRVCKGESVCARAYACLYACKCVILCMCARICLCLSKCARAFFNVFVFSAHMTAKQLITNHYAFSNTSCLLSFCS